MTKYCFKCKYYDCGPAREPCMDCIGSGIKKNWTPDIEDDELNDKDSLIAEAYVKAVDLRNCGDSDYADQTIEDIIRLLSEALSK